jgi:hypothetical protein
MLTGDADDEKKKKKIVRRKFDMEERAVIYDTLLGQADEYRGPPSIKGFFGAVVGAVDLALGHKFHLDGQSQVLLNMQQNIVTEMKKAMSSSCSFDKKTKFSPDFIKKVEEELSDPDFEIEDDKRSLWQSAFKIEVFLSQLKTRKAEGPNKKAAAEGKEKQAGVYQAAAVDQADGDADLGVIKAEDSETDRKKAKRSSTGSKKKRGVAELEESVNGLSEARIETTRMQTEAQERVARLQYESQERQQKNQQDFVQQILQLQQEAARQLMEAQERREAKSQETTAQLFQAILGMISKKNE